MDSIHQAMLKSGHLLHEIALVQSQRNRCVIYRCFTFQAILFYIPRYLWKTWEGGRVKMLVQDMNVPIGKTMS